MSEIFSRNEMLWGNKNQKILAEKHVLIIGLGGVGGFAAEALARSGIGKLTLIDFDAVSPSNINRQLIATHSTIGKKKTSLFEQRLKDINPQIEINTYENFYRKELNAEIFSEKIDFVVDAIDTVNPKIDLLEYCHKNKINIITSLGAGNRLDPTKLAIKDISEIKSSKCQFTKNILRILNKNGASEGITAVISTEKPRSSSKLKNLEKISLESGKEIEYTKVSPGSSPFVPPVVGYYMAYHMVNSLINL